MSDDADLYGVVRMPVKTFLALQSVDLPSRARIVLAYVTLHTFGPDQLPVVTLDPSILHRLTGLSRDDASAGLAELLRRAFLVRSAEHGYSFVQDPSLWRPTTCLEAS